MINVEAADKPALAMEKFRMARPMPLAAPVIKIVLYSIVSSSLSGSIEGRDCKPDLSKDGQEQPRTDKNSQEQPSTAKHSQAQQGFV